MGLWAGVTTTGLILPSLWLLSSPRIYSAAIIGGQFFVIGGLFFAFMGVEGVSRRTGNLWMAGIFWALAAGTRLLTAAQVLFISSTVVVVLILLSPSERRLPEVLRAAAAVGIPLLLGFVALGWYNAARFGSPFESGLRYQLTWSNLNLNHGQLFALKYVLPNLYNYILLPFATQAGFPFVAARSAIFPPFFDPSNFAAYHAEALAGLIVGAPFLIFALLPCAAIFQKLKASTAKLERQNLKPASTLQDWICIGLLGSSLISLLSVSFYFYITMRYLADFTLTLVLVAVIGFWQGLSLQPASGIKRTAYSISAGALALWSIGMSILLAAAVSNPFSTLNPHLFQQILALARLLSGHS